MTTSDAPFGESFSRLYIRLSERTNEPESMQYDMSYEMVMTQIQLVNIQRVRQSAQGTKSQHLYKLVDKLIAHRAAVLLGEVEQIQKEEYYVEMLRSMLPKIS